jgi:glycosyltransferase involved in cell wall biosynthesis
MHWAIGQQVNDIISYGGVKTPVSIGETSMKVVFCTLYLGDKPTKPFRESLEKTIPVIEKLGWEHSLSIEVGCPYISAARSKVLKKAMDDKADVIVFLDYDVSWQPEDMVKLLNATGDVVAGTYRKKIDEEIYMGTLHVSINNNPIAREDGALKASFVPAGFLKITREAVNKFAKSYPQLLFGEPMSPELDMFNHGAIEGVWYGEDYAFSKRWNECGGEIWLIPDLSIDHHRGDSCYEGNFHKYLLNYKEQL